MSNLIDILKHRSFHITIILTLVYFGIGFIFLHVGLADYGEMFFLFLPIALGIAVGKMERKKWVYLGFVVALIVFIGLLVIGEWEGSVCILMSLPIIVPLVWLGTLISRILVKKGFMKSRENLNVLIAPLVVFLLLSPIEKYLFSYEPEIIEVKTERIYPFTTKQVYHAIKSVDTLNAEKPFLMKLDLPIPEKCVIEKEEVGGLRTCYFSGGTITERITELEEGKVLKMDVIDYQLTGRNWLGFEEAIYFFDEVENNHCKLTRITTYTSVLRPRVYWEPLEKIGIDQEHQYVLDNLFNDLERKYGKK